jgi:hypothetical protein
VAVWTSELTKFSRTWSPYLFGKLFYLLAGIEQVFSVLSHVEVSTPANSSDSACRDQKHLCYHAFVGRIWCVHDLGASVSISGLGAKKLTIQRNPLANAVPYIQSDHNWLSEYL